jgi:hypothetical protein
MDSKYEMIVHIFMEDDTNANAIGELHFMILAALVKLQEDENPAPKRGGSRCGKNKSKPMHGGSCDALHRLFQRRVNIYPEGFPREI